MHPSTKSKHTPGPWFVEGPDDFGDFNIHSSENRLAVAAVVSNLRGAGEVRANADLTGAAPKMLEALKAWEAAEAMPLGTPARYSRKQEAKVRAHQMMRAAIAEAEGRE